MKILEKAAEQTWTSASGKRAPDTSEILRTALLAMISFIILAPVAWFILSSFKDLTDLSARPPKLFPSRWAFENYTEAFKMYDYLRYFMNSVKIGRAHV